jgi:protein-S-isoprenylcysteine O-methyltransferase Ste14
MTTSCSIPDPAQDHPHVIALPPYLALGHLGVGALLGWALGVDPRLPWLIRAAAALLALGGFGLIGSTIRVMRRAKTNVSPFHPTTAIVASGPFRLSRNPIYLGFLLSYLGIGVAAGSIGVGILALWPVLMAVLHFGVVKREEHYLLAKFGEPYRAYLGSVRRWL